MEVSYRDIIRETKNAINARLDMLESLISMNTNNNTNNSLHETIMNQAGEIEELKSTLYRVSDNITNIVNRITIMERNAEPSIASPYEPMPELCVDNDLKVVTIKEEVVEEVEEEVVEEEVVEEVEEEVEEELEEESSLELEEFEYKGMTLYRDPNNKVYRMDEEGALSEPLGIWDNGKQRIKKIV